MISKFDVFGQNEANRLISVPHTKSANGNGALEKNWAVVCLVCFAALDFGN